VTPDKVKLTIEVTTQVRDVLLDESTKRRKLGLKTWSLGSIVGEAVMKVYAAPATTPKKPNR